MQDSRYRQGEFRDYRIESGAVVGGHLVGAPHDPYRRCEGAATGVLELPSGIQFRLLANDAHAAHFLFVAVAIGDDPVAADQFRTDRSSVLDGDVVGEDVSSFFGCRLFLDVLRFGGNPDVVLGIVVHFSTLLGRWRSARNSIEAETRRLGKP